MWYRGFKIQARRGGGYWIEAFQCNFNTMAEATHCIDDFYAKKGAGYAVQNT